MDYEFLCKNCSIDNPENEAIILKALREEQEEHVCDCCGIVIINKYGKVLEKKGTNYCK